MKSNRAIGNHFESEFCEMLSHHGFWVHNMAQNKAGQPADVIAVKNNIAILIDCKVCANDRFRLSRVEENQERAMTKWETVGNTECYFALQMSDGAIYMIQFDEIAFLQINGEKSINRDEVSKYRTIGEWVKEFDENYNR